MQVSIQRPDLEKYVDEQVRTGQYPTPEAFIENALEAFITQQTDLPSGEELRRLIKEGQEDADRGELFDGEEVFRDLLTRNAQRPRLP